MQKLDLKKKYKEIYNPKNITIVDVPDLSYITITGEGNPNTSELFQESVSALYAIAYTISMSPKQEWYIKDFTPFVVPPLEGVWDLIKGDHFDGNKDNLKWKIMILMPDFVHSKTFLEAQERAYTKKKNNHINRVEFELFKGRKCCVFKHLGSYDDEPESFKSMIEYLETTEYKRFEDTHREIYLSDFRKTLPQKLKTVLSFEVSYRDIK